jgi:hypothetical protein
LREEGKIDHKGDDAQTDRAPLLDVLSARGSRGYSQFAAGHPGSPISHPLYDQLR